MAGAKKVNAVLAMDDVWESGKVGHGASEMHRCWSSIFDMCTNTCPLGFDATHFQFLPRYIFSYKKNRKTVLNFPKSQNMYKCFPIKT